MNIKKIRDDYGTNKQEVLYGISKSIVRFTGNEKKSTDFLNSIKGIYEGKRCFILGNGPSLSAEDLDKLTEEITFASNRIYKIFDKTCWRPTYYTIFDEGVGADKDLQKNVQAMSCVKFVRSQGYYVYRKLGNNICYVNTWYDRKYLDCPQFSEDVSDGIYSIATVTYNTIEIARWMGFSNIYLLGMDNRYAYSKLRDGSVVRNEGVVSYFSDTGQTLPDPSKAVSTWEMDLAYEFADKYSRTHGFRIYNATRGGFLEKFERADLDEVLQQP